MSPTIIILLLIAVAVAVVVWLARKPSSKSSGPRETDTGWDDPVTPATSDADAPPSDQSRH